MITIAAMVLGFGVHVGDIGELLMRTPRRSAEVER